MGGESYGSWRDEVLASLAQFPAGVSAGELAEHFDHVRTPDYFRKCLSALAREGVAVRVEPPASDPASGVPARGPHPRVRYRLADEKSVEASPEGGGAL
ncbi:hypothetical protein ACNF49_02700 [Actinomadura sp. ATCC 39365]